MGRALRSIVSVSAAAILLGEAARNVADEATISCDVIVAGGSLASLAAAVTAANVSSTARVCFTEVTDWPGGQMTASGVPAIDFGTDNRVRDNMAGGLADLLFGPLMPGGENLGDCWVSSKCFQPQIVMESWIMPLIASYPNLLYLPRTAVLSSQRDATTGRVTSVQAVQRTPAAGTTGWETLLSAQLSDWYDPAPSAAYPEKNLITLSLSSPHGVVIDATEFGDILVTSGVGFAQVRACPASRCKCRLERHEAATASYQHRVPVLTLSPSRACRASRRHTRTRPASSGSAGRPSPSPSTCPMASTWPRRQTQSRQVRARGEQR